MSRLVAILALLLLTGGALSGCDKNAKSAPAYQVSDPHRYPEAEPEAAAPGMTGKNLVGYAPATDFTGAAPEDAASKAGAMFDGSKGNGGLGADVSVEGGNPTGGKGKRVQYTAASSPRVTDLNGKVPPLPDGYDYSGTGATPGSAKGAGQALLEFAAFQVEQKFPSVAPIMSRMGWHAEPPARPDSPQKPYRVTVHHTAGRHPMTEEETAKAVKDTQHYHMVGRGLQGTYNFKDIGYHFLIAGDGRVAEGVRAEYWGTHAGGANAGNLGIAMMGNFDKYKPTDASVESLTRLVTFLALKYQQKPKTKGFLEPHLHYNNTGCPGRHMMSILESLRQKIDREHEIVMAGGRLGADFTPLAVVAAPSA